MASITRVSGGSQPVFATDVLNPVAAGASTAATPVNFQGPKLDFFRAVANASVATQQDVNEYVGNVIQAIQQISTVAMYQVDGTTLSFAVFPTGAFADAAAFLAVANITPPGGGTYDYQLNSATSIGFKLSAS
jgi:hypothetical protein